jgi:hypothetical protein
MPVGKGRLKERCGLEARTNFFSFKKVAKTRCGLDSRIYGNSIFLRGPQHFSKHGGEHSAFNSVVCKEAVYIGSELGYMQQRSHLLSRPKHL